MEKKKAFVSIADGTIAFFLVAGGQFYSPMSPSACARANHPIELRKSSLNSKRPRPICALEQRSLMQERLSHALRGLFPLSEINGPDWVSTLCLKHTMNRGATLRANSGPRTMHATARSARSRPPPQGHVTLARQCGGSEAFSWAPLWSIVRANRCLRLLFCSARNLVTAGPLGEKKRQF